MSPPKGERTRGALTSDVDVVFKNAHVGRILSIAMIGGLPCADLSIDILPGI